MSITFGPDAFVVGADAGITSYDTNSYVYALGSGTQCTVNATNDRVQQTNTNADLAVRIKAAAVATDGNGTVTMTQSSGVSDRTANPAVRMKTDNSGNFYLMYMNRLSAQANLYRVDASSFVLLSSPSRAIGASHTVTLKAVTNGSQVDLTGTISGLSDVTFSDTNANRKLDGTPGWHMFSAGSANTAWLDDVSVDDPVTYDAATFQAMLMQTQSGAAMIGLACRGVYG